MSGEKNRCAISDIYTIIECTKLLLTESIKEGKYFY
jgi:hypothetical protein